MGMLDSHLPSYETGAAKMISLQDATGAVPGLPIPAPQITYTRRLQANTSKAPHRVLHPDLARAVI
jgi:hypothetical protein